ncbi:MAG: MarC family protein, partial [Woeseiaceae bacterium]
GLVSVLISVATVAGVAYFSFAWLGQLIERIRPESVEVILRIGGLLLMTIGMQMLLGGLKNFFA